MAYNTDEGWRKVQQMFQSSVYSEDVRRYLIECLEILSASHDVRVLRMVSTVRGIYKFTPFLDNKVYKCKLVRTLYMHDGVDFVPMDQEWIFTSTEVNSNKKASNIDNRLQLQYSSNRWKVTWLTDSIDHASGKYEFFDRKESEEPKLTTEFEAKVDE